MNFRLYPLSALSKGLSVFFFVLLPVFYAHKSITSAEVGYVGAVSIAMLVVGALVVVRKLHNLSTKTLLQIAAWLQLAATAALYAATWSHNLAVFVLAYGLSGLATGLSVSGINALIAHSTKQGERFTDIARLSMVTDIVRIGFPVLVALVLTIGGTYAAITLIALASIAFLYTVHGVTDQSQSVSNEVPAPAAAGRLLHNLRFRWMLSLEFLDSFASSQLFVYLPILFLMKGHSLESSLLLQTAVFTGYLSGRWLIGRLAKRISGLRAVAVAEFGMVACILLLLAATNLPVLYILSLLLGVFARGTSPVIKSLAFDSLHGEHVKQGSAMHVVAGDSGSALGQLCFGLLLAWAGAKTPFLAAAVVATIIILLSLRLTIPTKRSVATSHIPA